MALPSDESTLAPERGSDVDTLAGEVPNPTRSDDERASGDGGLDPRALLSGEAGSVRLGHHVLLHELGRGGMGIVYAAYDDQLDRKVAIKLLRTRESAMLSRRLAREAQAMARLSHPNVVQVYEIGEWQKLAFLVMEFVDGLTLSRWLADSKRSRAELIEVFVAAGRGLAAAHAQGLVHRDFKPDNVMVRRDGRVMVMDFGLARGRDSNEPDPESSSAGLERSASALSMPLTQVGALTGTPAYMAPEQFLGQATDARTDQFSFCVALWEALYGSRPFRGDNVAALALEVTAGNLSEPSEHGVPAWLRRVLSRGLSREPMARYPSMEALLAALEHDPTRRRRALVVGASALALTLAAVIGVRIDQAQQREAALEGCEQEGEIMAADWNEASIARLESVFLASKAGYATSAWSHARRFMDDYAQAWSSLRVATCREAHVDETRSLDSHDAIMACLDKRRATFVGLLAAWEQADAKLVARAPIAASGLTPLSTCTSELRVHDVPPDDIRERVEQLAIELERVRAMHLAGEYEPGLARALELVHEAEQLGWPSLLAEARLLVSNLQLKTGKYDDARRSGEQAFVDAIRAGDDSIMEEAAQSLTYLYGSQLRDFEGGLLWGQIATELHDRMGATATAREASLHDDIGIIELARGESEAAIESHRRSLAIREQVLGPEHPSTASSHINLGGALASRGEYELAHEHFDTAVRIKAQALGDDHPDVATAINNIGMSYYFQGKYEQSREALARALALRERALGPEHPQVADTMANLALAQAGLGQIEEAEQMLERSLEIFVAALGEGHVREIGPLNNLGMVLALRGEDERAIATYRKAIAIGESVLGPQHPDGSGAWLNLGDLALARGRIDEAREHYRRAANILVESPDHPFAALVASALGRVALESGDLAEARTRLAEADAKQGGLGEPIELAKTRFALARIARLDGDATRASELAAAAREQAIVAGWPGRELVVAIDAWVGESKSE